MSAKAVKELSPELQKLREMDSKMVKGRFSCLEPLGGSVTFPFKKYRGYLKKLAGYDPDELLEEMRGT